MLFYIGISGKAGSGKDTAAGFMKEIFKEYNISAEIIPFALELKKMVLELLEFTEEEIYQTKPPKVRAMLQKFGTDVIRKRDPKFWIRQLENNAQKFDNPYGYVFILVPDVRFENEALFIEEKGGPVFRIERRGHVSQAGDHLSETELDNKSHLWEVIYNEGELEEFRDRVLRALHPILVCQSVEALERFMRS